jgi:coenzyme F420-reducing hydrogenase beta subunit
MCPADALRIEWNKYGEYVPVEQAGKCTDCGKCLQVCPFWNQQINETDLAKAEFENIKGIKHNPVTGFYLDLYAGYSKVDDHRINAAAGGLTTWLLETLLKEKIINRACCVTPCVGPDTLFRYTIVDSVEDIRKASRSVYYPVELSKIIPEILNSSGRCAVVGLPCVLKGIRLAVSHNNKLGDRIVVLIGLICGQLKSKYFAEYLCALAGGDPSELISATFRVKDSQRHHLDHRFEFTCGFGDNPAKGHIYQSEGMSWLWGQDCFKLNACNFCDDVTAEVADVTFGDAVDEAYSYGNTGSNFAIVRSPLVNTILRQGADSGQLVLDRVSEQAVLERQKGLVKQKRSDLQHRLYRRLSRTDVSYVPVKRVNPGRRYDILANADMEFRRKMSVASRETYLRFRYKNNLVEQMENTLKSLSENANKKILFRIARFIVREKQRIQRAIKNLAGFIWAGKTHL